ncbi:MAG: TonB-dependent receptor plug domain-containing protein [Rhodothermaceae bacterium]|nr:TonB-dependent receptor plug domain-containing protein [Rhodothermaceae bacterium]
MAGYKIIRGLIVGFGLCCIAAQVLAQTSAIIGKVIDGETGQPLVGANILLVGTGVGSATDAEGDFEILNLTPGTHTLRISFVGYAAQESVIELSEGEEYVWNVDMVPGTDLNPIQVTAGRHQEMVLDAPASIDIVTVRDIQLDVAPSTVRALRNVTGVDMVQTGIDRHEVALRGFNNTFSRDTHVLTDYRDAGAASIGVNLHSVMPALAIDTERIEVVRGPGSALYGPGVDSGVIHYISKDAFSYPGATVSVSGGQRSMLNLQGRVATVFGKNLGVKVLGSYATAEDFALTGCDSALIGAERFSECADPEDAVQLFVDGARETRYKKVVLSGNVDWRIGTKTMLSLNGGFGGFNGTVLTGVGTVQGEDFIHTYGQIRLSSGSFFVQAYVNSNDSGGSYVYGGDPVVEYSEEYTIQAQYAKDITSRQQLIGGVDVTFDRPDSRETVLGRNEYIDNIDEYGAYLQSSTKISDKLDLILALRGDYNSVVEKVQVSPRFAVVLKPSPTSSFRATYNRSFSSPDATGYFLDLVAASLGGLNVRARGGANWFTFSRNPDYLELGAPSALVASSMLPGMEGAPVPVGIDTGVIYGLMYEGLAAIPDSELADLLAEAGLSIPPQLIPLLKEGLNPAVTPIQGFSPGVLGILNLSTLTLNTGPEVNNLQDIPPIESTVSQSWEIGYKGVISDKVLLAVEGYFSKRKNFTGSLQVRTPFVLVPNLHQDLIRDIAAGLTANDQIAGALGLFGLTPQLAAEMLVGLAGGDLPDGETPVAIVQANENNRGEGYFPELMLSYPNFGNIQYFGMDVSMQVIASDALTLFGNASWISDDYFDHTEVGEDSEDLALALNAPGFKVKLGGQYRHRSGFSVNASGRFTEGFPMISGQYVGQVQSYTVIDIGVGYAINQTGIRADLGISNLFDSDHREFVGAPRLGRIANARLTYTTDWGN